MKHDRGIKRRKWTSDAAVYHIERVLCGRTAFGLTAVSALDYLRGAWPEAEALCRAQIVQHLAKKEASREYGRIA